MAFSPSREDFSLRSKSELLDYIEQQSEQISRLETRFRDVVRAYRGIIKEKEALEASLKALSEGGRGGGDGVGGESGDSGVERSSEGGVREGGEEVKEGGEGEDEERTSETDSSEKDAAAVETKPSGDAVLVSSLRQQLSTLTSSLHTLTEERSKTEASFQRDKKSMLAQQDQLSKQLQSERLKAEEDISKLQTRLQEMQNTLRLEQSAREEEQNTHSDMLRELQALIATERDGKEALGMQLQEMESEIIQLRNQISENRSIHDREQEEIVQSLTLQVENLQSQLRLAEKHASQPSPLVEQLQREIQRLKEEHAQSLLLEQQKLTDNEERLKQQSQREEQKVASLETKISQLSETVGSYVQLREQDQLTAQKLKERVAQLDSENTALTRAHVERQEADSQLSGQVTVLQERVARLKAFLKIATSRINERTTVPANLEEMSVSEYRDMLGKEPSGKDYHHELVQLKDEFERYKTRAQAVLRNKECKVQDTTSSMAAKELQRFQEKVSVLQEETMALQSEKEEEEERHLLQMQRLREEMREQADRSRREFASLDAQHKEKLQDLHQHVQSTRERTFKLLSEKDSEIQHLRGELQALLSHSQSHRMERSLSTISNSSSSHNTVTENGSEDSFPLHQTPSGKFLNLSTQSTESVSAVQEILEQPSPAPVGEPKLLHFLQEQQRRDSELASVRRKKFELEDSIRELQEREQRHLEQTAFLKEQIRKLERDRSRETENLEYLKNVILHYMCSDSYGREQMVSPIATVLHFSPDEVRLIKDKMAARRWIPRKT